MQFNTLDEQKMNRHTELFTGALLSANGTHFQGKKRGWWKFNHKVCNLAVQEVKFLKNFLLNDNDNDDEHKSS